MNSDWGQIGGAVAGAVTGVGNIVASHQMNVQDRENAAIDRQFNADEAYKARDFNQWQATVARDWSEKMSNSAYQRSRDDMKKAGLNPIMMMNSGGASTPSASPASGSGASAPSRVPTRDSRVGEALEKTIASGKEMAIFQREMAQRDLNIAKTGVDTIVSQELAGLTKSRGQNAALDYTTRDPHSEYDRNKAENRLKSRQSDFDRKLIPFDGILKRVGDTIGAASSAKGLGRASGMGHGKMGLDEFDRLSRKHYEMKSGGK